MYQRWYDAPTLAGINGAMVALVVLAVLTSAVAPVGKPAPKSPQSAQNQRQHIHLVFYGPMGSGELSHCKAMFRWTWDGEKHTAEEWLEDEECEIPTHPVNTWMTCDFDMSGYWVRLHEIESVEFHCWVYNGNPSQVEVILLPQTDT